MKNSGKPLINCEINLILTWSYKFVLSNETKATTFAITDTKIYVLINPNFQEVNRLFVLSLENNEDRIVRTKYYLPPVEIKDYNVMKK